MKELLPYILTGLISLITGLGLASLTKRPSITIQVPDISAEVRAAVADLARDMAEQDRQWQEDHREMLKDLHAAEIRFEELGDRERAAYLNEKWGLKVPEEIEP